VLDELISNSLADGSYYSDPYPLFDELRKTSPVYRSETVGGWILTRHQEVDAILRDSEIFSSKGRITHLLNQLEPEIQPKLELLHFHFSRGLAHSDAPEHRRLRGLLARAFTPKMIEGLRPRIREISTELISNLNGDIDLIGDLLTPLPARVVGELLGSQESDIPHLIRWANAINGLYEKGGRISADKALHAELMLSEMRSFVSRLITERRAKKSKSLLTGEEDVLSALVMQDEDSLSEEEMLSTMVSLFVAGHETTTHLLGNGWFALLKFPEWIEEMRQKPELIPPLVEEMARFDGSVPRSWRIAKIDTEIAGIKIPAGELVMPMLAAANRDPSVFEHPHLFNPLRDSKKHLAYGKGVHVCLGAPLARIEAQEVISLILESFSSIELSRRPEDLEWREDLALRGLKNLPVKLS
jgi:cytochrome P450